MRFSRISQLGYFRGHLNSHHLRGRASATQRWRDWSYACEFSTRDLKLEGLRLAVSYLLKSLNLSSHHLYSKNKGTHLFIRLYLGIETVSCRLLATDSKDGHSLRASSQIWASEASLAKTHEQAAKPRGAEAEAPRSRVLARLAQIGELARRLRWRWIETWQSWANIFKF